MKNNRLLVGLLLAFGFSATASAEFDWNRKADAMVNSGDAQRGQALAKKQKCAKCHGDTGISDEDDTPSIAGQVAAYTYKQLVNYKSGERDERDMKKVARKLTEQDMADLGAFFATQEGEKKAGGKVPPLVEKGDKKRLLLACSDCHNESKDARKIMEVPATIEGQKPEYFLNTMMEFKEGDRSNDLFGRMRFITERLTEDEIEALAAYYSTRPAPEEE